MLNLNIFNGLPADKLPPVQIYREFLEMVGDTEENRKKYGCLTVGEIQKQINCVEYLSFKLCITKKAAEGFLTAYNIKSESELILKFKTPQALEVAFWRWLK